MGDRQNCKVYTGGAHCSPNGVCLQRGGHFLIWSVANDPHDACVNNRRSISGLNLSTNKELLGYFMNVNRVTLERNDISVQCRTSVSVRAWAPDGSLHFIDRYLEIDIAIFVGLRHVACPHVDLQ